MDLEVARKLMESLVVIKNSDLVKVKKLPVLSEADDMRHLVSMPELEGIFCISRSQLLSTLRSLGLSPVGEKINYKMGKRLPGVGKVMYHRDVVYELQKALCPDSEMERIKKLAQSVLDKIHEENQNNF